MPFVLSTASPDRARRLLLAALVLVVLVTLAWRLEAVRRPYHHPDEVIAVEVVRAMDTRRDLDANWARVDALPEHFRYPQYNFAGAHVLTRYLQEAVRLLPGPGQRWAEHLARVTEQRSVAAVYIVLALLLAAAVLCAGSFQLGMDALYARPESLTGLLVMGLFITALWQPAGALPRGLQALGLGAITGLLLSIKVSFAPLVPWAVLAAAWVGSRNRQARGEALRRAALGSFGLVLGFLAGAPTVPANLPDYLNGVRALSAQYGLAHFPNGLGLGAPWWQRLGHGLQYLLLTTGALLPVALCGVWHLWRRRAWVALALVALLGAQLVLFLGTPVFFERNFSHMLTVLAVLAALALAPLARRPVLAASALLLVGWAVPGLQQADMARREAALRERYPDAVVVDGGLLGVASLPLAADRLGGRWLVRTVDYGHPLDRQRREALRQTPGVSVLPVLGTAFSHLPASTVHAYFDAQVQYLVVDRPPGAEGLSLHPLGTARPWPGAPEVLRSDDAWTPDAAQALPAWSTRAGGDVAAGVWELRWPRACGTLDLPWLTGPDPARQVLRLRWRDAAGAERQAEAPRWRAIGSGMTVRLQVGPSAHCTPVQILLADEGGRWGGVERAAARSMT